jgi:hypothetical protein
MCMNKSVQKEAPPMKRTWSALFRKLALPALLAVLFTVFAPAAAFAGGGHGRHKGRGYYGGHAYYGGARVYYPRPYYGGTRFTFGFGFGPAPYAYGPAYVYAPPPPPCVPAGYYDRWGRWRYYPGCYAVPYGY